MKLCRRSHSRQYEKCSNPVCCNFFSGDSYTKRRMYCSMSCYAFMARLRSGHYTPKNKNKVKQFPHLVQVYAAMKLGLNLYSDNY